MTTLCTLVTMQGDGRYTAGQPSGLTDEYLIGVADPRDIAAVIAARYPGSVVLEDSAPRVVRLRRP